jgi:hypothetical protein
MPGQLAAIVEGHGEVEALPILVRRIAQMTALGYCPKIGPILRAPASRLLKREGELERLIELAARKLAGRGAILILLDCDDGCPAREAPDLLKRARQARSDIPISVVMAKREFETWFLAVAESLRGQRNLPDDLMPPPDPEAIRGAKEWLSHRMPHGYGYIATSDQPAFTGIFDLDTARSIDSFDKCYREIERLVAILRQESDARTS